MFKEEAFALCIVQCSKIENVRIIGQLSKTLFQEFNTSSVASFYNQYYGGRGFGGLSLH